MTRLGPLRPAIKFDGQRYVDEPMFVEIKPTPVAAALMRMGVHVPKVEILIGYQHIHLRWMKPGPDGTLIPANL